MADIKLEHSTLKVPYEILNKKFRNAQKTIDREVSHVIQATNDLETCMGEPGQQPATAVSTVGQVSSLLVNVVDKLVLLKRKAGESISSEEESARICKKRVEHLKEYDSSSTTAADHWQKQRLDRMLVEYLLRAGYYDTALKLARQSNIEMLTNIEVFMVAKEVEESLLRREIPACLAWCHDNKSKLRKLKSTLEFNLRTQEFIELIRSNRHLEAIKYARKFFTSSTEVDPNEVKKVMGLLAYRHDTHIAIYRELFAESRWSQLADQFRAENFKLHQLDNNSVFMVVFEAGLSAIKTPHCYRPESKNPDCPVCSHNLNVLAQPLPFSHCAHSRLVCSISGQIMNENNPPLMLPNGYVYGEMSLKMMAAENNGYVTCPKTNETFKFDQAEKVFIM